MTPQKTDSASSTSDSACAIRPAAATDARAGADPVARAPRAATPPPAASAPAGGYTAGALAELAGVTVRALHHYEAEGLLRPARDASGYRRYDASQVERLQQILLFRACGLALGDIRRSLDDPAFDRAAALRSRLADLRAQQEQLKALMGTVEKTIAALEGETTMTDKERFEGLKRQAVDDNERTYGAEARERWGDAAVDAANERTLALDEKAWNDREALGRAVIDQLRAAFADGTGDPTGPEARALAEMHGRWLALHWGEGAYSRAAHAALADGYVADERFTRYYDDAVAPGATRFLRDAIAAWCAD